jgi:TolB-like protein
VRQRGFIVCLSGFLAAVPVVAQSPARAGLVVFNLRFDGAYANVLEPGDTAIVHAATSRLLATLRAFDGVAVVDSEKVAAAVTAAEADGNPCDNACAQVVARRLGARWVVKGVVLKTSNLVWILRADLLDAPTGKVILADSYELKGDAARMAPAGAHVFAQRIERAVAEQHPSAVDP